MRGCIQEYRLRYTKIADTMTNSLTSKNNWNNFLGSRYQQIFQNWNYYVIFHLTSWTTGNLIFEFCDLILVKLGNFFTHFGMARVSLAINDKTPLIFFVSEVAQFCKILLPYNFLWVTHLAFLELSRSICPDFFDATLISGLCRLNWGMNLRYQI